MLLDPFEKQLDLPPGFVQFANGRWWRAKQVGQKDECFPRLWIFEANVAQMMGVALLTVEPRQGHRLIADDPLRPVARCRVDSSQVGIRFGAGNKKRAGVVKREEPFEIQIGAVYYIDRRGFRNHQVEHIDIVHLAVGNMYKTRDISTQVQQRMHLHRRLGAAKWRPWKQRQAQVYRSGVQRINRVRQVQPKILFGIEFSSLRDQPLCKLGIDSPVSSFVGIRQGRALDRRTNAHVVQLGRLRGETRFDIAQALPVGQLRKRQSAKMFGARKCANTMIPVVPGHDPVKSFPRKNVHDLCKQRLSGIHRIVSATRVYQEDTLSNLRSSRGHPKSAVT